MTATDHGDCTITDPLVIVGNCLQNLAMLRERMETTDRLEQIENLTMQLGERAHVTAELAAQMALCAIAEDVRQIRIWLLAQPVNGGPA